MNRIIKISFIAALSLALSIPSIEAQGHRGGRSGGGSHSRGNTRVENRGSNSRHGGSNSSSRPGSSSSRPGQNHNNSSSRPGRGQQHNARPDQSNQNNKHQGYRPGNNNRPGADHNQGYRPGNNNRPGADHNQGYRPGNNNRPGANHNQGYRPGNNNRPGADHNQGYRPGRRPSYSYGGSHRPPLRPGNRPPVLRRPYRPALPPARPFFRPRPPRGWRPVYHANLWTNILGITIGMTINSAIDRLLSDGYSVVGYDGNEIYLSNVMQYSMLWPDATMYYSGGQFAGTRFYYSTLAYDTARYNQAYSYFDSLYGSPVLFQNSAELLSATWYGANNQYITLEFAPMLTDSGRRYFTTLSVGL